MAAPHIVGIVAMMRQMDASLSVSRIKELFKQYSKAVITEPEKSMAGFFQATTWLDTFKTSKIDTLTTGSDTQSVAT
jgi:hypothetical protein